MRSGLSSTAKRRTSRLPKPPQPAQLMDHRPNRPRVVQTCDVYVDAGGLIYADDDNGGLSILEMTA